MHQREPLYPSPATLLLLLLRLLLLLLHDGRTLRGGSPPAPTTGAAVDRAACTSKWRERREARGVCEQACAQLDRIQRQANERAASAKAKAKGKSKDKSKGKGKSPKAEAAAASMSEEKGTAAQLTSLPRDGCHVTCQPCGVPDLHAQRRAHAGCAPFIAPTV